MLGKLKLVQNWVLRLLFRVLGLGSRVMVCVGVEGLGFWCECLGFGVWGLRSWGQEGVPGKACA
jgi:hypothetical protein